MPSQVFSAAIQTTGIEALFYVTTRANAVQLECEISRNVLGSNLESLTISIIQEPYPLFQKHKRHNVKTARYRQYHHRVSVSRHRPRSVPPTTCAFNKAAERLSSAELFCAREPHIAM
ncbi:uncharacterized protein EAF01_007140 [Botrytis porri]|uniref:uncharacterized protein n=1 Tax=Botrytis porri TaxID=87229 RepID=UPI0019014400|nr:uncharacterized protein EAF01_007140 [Botrytis porri]KAF7901842.1 hypothetical protein EAF01_007140 [Botrytis porri]